MDKAQLVVDLLINKGLKISTAESCTGGLLAERITSIPGSSKCFEMGVITYSNQSKIKILNVSQDTLETFGAVSEQTALEMSTGIKTLSNADIAIGITGIAGPTGGTLNKPIGLVYIAINDNIYKLKLTGDRKFIQKQAVYFALSKVFETY